MDTYGIESSSQSPSFPCGELAKYTGFDNGWLKVHIRKFKNLGLTISHRIGYEFLPELARAYTSPR